MKEHGFKAEDIAEIHIDQCSLNWAIAYIREEVKWNLQTVPECQFSLPYTVAKAAYDKSISLDPYTP